MNISKVKAILAYLTGGVAGIVEYLLKVINEQILAKAKPEDMKKYALDVQAVSLCLNTIVNNHAADMSEAKRAALVATIAAVDRLAAALEDANVTSEELDAIIDAVTAAVKAWKEAK